MKGAGGEGKGKGAGGGGETTRIEGGRAGVKEVGSLGLR